jgi:hypothetical protein
LNHKRFIRFNIFPDRHLKVDAVRRQFGNKLFDFLVAIVPTLVPEERQAAVSSMKKMYGLDLAEFIKPNETGRQNAPGSAFSPKTVRLLQAVRAEAESRKVA